MKKRKSSSSVARKAKKAYFWDFDSKKAENLDKYAKRDMLR